MKNPPWFKKRRYSHFDWPIYSVPKISRRVKNPEEVSRWNFFPFLRSTIQTKKYDKVAGIKIKERPIMYACHADAHLYAYYAFVIAELYENLIRELRIDTSILAFRRAIGKCNIEFSKEAFDTISALGECVALTFDVEKFFDSIDHASLKRKWADVLKKITLPPDHYNIYKSLTKFSFVDKEQLLKDLGISKYGKKPLRLCDVKKFRDLVRKKGLIQVNKTQKGIPQGSPMSGLLSNIALLDFDKKIVDETFQRNAQYYRYCDDIIIICPIHEESFFRDLVISELKKLKLDAHPHKTKIHRFNFSNENLLADYPLQYLGFMFDGQRTYIRSSSIMRFQSKMENRVKRANRLQNKREKRAVSSGHAVRPLFKRNLLARNTHLGRRNFIRYGLRAKSIMGSETIRRQLSRLKRKFFVLLSENSM